MRSLASLLLALFFFGQAFAQQPRSTFYALPMDVQSIGGGEAAKSNNYVLDDTIGEGNIGAGRSTTYDLNAGYRQAAEGTYIGLGCSTTASLGSIAFNGAATGSGTCTVTTDADAGYSLSWKAGGNGDDSLVGLWKFDETTGTTAYDLSGYGNNGTLTNGPTISTSVPSTYFSTRSLSFDGVNDYVETGLTSGKVYTWSAWVKPSAFTGYHTIISSPSTNYSLMDLYNSAGSFWTNDGLGGQNLGVTGLSTGTWYHIVFVREGDSITNGYKAYLNGVLKGQANSGVWSPSSTLKIGGRVINFGEYFNGNIDEVRIYNRALSQPEIQQLAALAPPGSLVMSGSQLTHIDPFMNSTTGGLVGHWRMDEIPGGGTVADSSGYGNNGTPNGTTGTNNLPQPSTSVPSGTNFRDYRSMNFDGTDDYVNIPDSSAFSPSALSVSAWVKFNTIATGQMLVSKSDSVTNAREWYVDSTASSIEFLLSNPTGSLSSSVSTGGSSVTQTGRWYHVVGTYDGTTQKTYLDGVLKNSSSFSSGITDGSAPVQLGARNFGTSGFLNGTLDDVRIYNRALSAAEVAALHGTPQTWSVDNGNAQWGGRIRSASTDTDAKWGTDGSSDKWLGIGDGNYPVVTRSSRTATTGSTEVFQVKAEIGKGVNMPSGLFQGTVEFTATAL